MVVLLWFLGCAAQETTPQLLIRALTLAHAGDPAAWEACASLRAAEDRGMCQVAAAKGMPDRGAACDTIETAYWRGECWFEAAEDLAHATKWDDALAACGHGEAFRDDCARHVWWTASMDGTGSPELRARVVAAFPGAADEMTASEAPIVAISADLEAARERTEAGEAATAAAQATDTRHAWEVHFRGAGGQIDPSECPAAEEEACLAAARDVYVRHWRRAVERNPEARARLCKGEGAVGAQLLPSDHPVLRAALEDLRKELCQ